MGIRERVVKDVEELLPNIRGGFVKENKERLNGLIIMLRNLINIGFTASVCSSFYEEENRFTCTCKKIYVWMGKGKLGIFR